MINSSVEILEFKEWFDERYSEESEHDRIELMKSLIVVMAGYMLLPGKEAATIIKCLEKSK